MRAPRNYSEILPYIKEHIIQRRDFTQPDLQANKAVLLQIVIELCQWYPEEKNLRDRESFCRWISYQIGCSWKNLVNVYKAEYNDTRIKNGELLPRGRELNPIGDNWELLMVRATSDCTLRLLDYYDQIMVHMGHSRIEYEPKEAI